MEVYVSDNAFLAMVTAAIEVFQKETLGILLGYRSDRSYVVQNSITYQTSDRSNALVARNDTAHRRIEAFLQNVVSHARIIGDFHSHPQYGKNRGGFEPSDEDIEEMREDAVYIIVEINKKYHERRWGYNRDGTMSGTVGDYYLKIAGWYIDSKSGKPRLGTVRCPFGVGFHWQ
jgi:proteasome lid subunit RPN8/RPN11